MTKPLFIYGTLQHVAVRDAVLQCHTQDRPYDFQSAQLSNHQVYHVANTAYPMIVDCVDGEAVGLCWYGLTDSDLSILDRFEGVNYSRVSVVVQLTSSGQLVEADIYKPMQHLPRGSLWHFDTWSETGLETFLQRDFHLDGVRAPDIG